MNQIVSYLVSHGYSVLFFVIFARQLCLPLPGILFLLAAGALAGAGRLSFALVVVVSVVGSVLADWLWFEAGRWKGDSVMHLIHGLAGISRPNFDIKRLFTKYGERSLLIAKFVVGLDAVAPPFAGVFGTSLGRFLAYDVMGSALWVGAYAGLGCAFSSQLDRAVALAGSFGTWVGIAVLAAAIFFVLNRSLRWHRFLRAYRLARITAQELKEKLDRGENVVIIDLHGCPLHVSSHEGIPGAFRINPHKLRQYDEFPIPHDWTNHEMVLYCACPQRYSSSQTAAGRSSGLAKFGISRRGQCTGRNHQHVA